MSISETDISAPTAKTVRFDGDSMRVDLSDGRSMSVPTSWYPRLLHGTAQERENWHLIGAGEGIHWPELDEDIEIEALIHGLRSKESQKSLADWLKERENKG